jgi:hypothetical protein
MSILYREQIQKRAFWQHARQKASNLNSRRACIAGDRKNADSDRRLCDREGLVATRVGSRLAGDDAPQRGIAPGSATLCLGASAWGRRGELSVPDPQAEAATTPHPTRPNLTAYHKLVWLARSPCEALRLFGGRAQETSRARCIGPGS